MEEFRIPNEEYIFNMEFNESNELTVFTATKDEVTYDCRIQLTSQSDPHDLFCCRPGGPCTTGGC